MGKKAKNAIYITPPFFTEIVRRVAMLMVSPVGKRRRGERTCVQTHASFKPLSHITTAAQRHITPHTTRTFLFTESAFFLGAMPPNPHGSRCALGLFEFSVYLRCERVRVVVR